MPLTRDGNKVLRVDMYTLYPFQAFLWVLGGQLRLDYADMIRRWACRLRHLV
jgi:hypothetical protein